MLLMRIFYSTLENYLSMKMELFLNFKNYVIHSNFLMFLIGWLHITHFIPNVFNRLTSYNTFHSWGDSHSIALGLLFSNNIVTFLSYYFMFCMCWEEIVLVLFWGDLGRQVSFCINLYDFDTKYKYSLNIIKE